MLIFFLILFLIILVFPLRDNQLIKYDLLEVVLDAGAEDLVDEGDYFEVITSSTDLSNILEALKVNNIEHTNAELTLRAETSVSLDQEMSEKVLKIMDFMDELDDVQEVHTNAEFPENFEVKE